MRTDVAQSAAQPATEAVMERAFAGARRFGSEYGGGLDRDE